MSRRKARHELYNAVWWDHFHRTDIFHTPAPLWDTCSERVCCLVIALGKPTYT